MRRLIIYGDLALRGLCVGIFTGLSLLAVILAGAVAFPAP